MEWRPSQPFEVTYPLSTESRIQTDGTGRFVTAPTRAEDPTRRLPPKNLP